MCGFVSPHVALCLLSAHYNNMLFRMRFRIFILFFSLFSLSSLFAHDQHDQPLKGEGIGAFLQRNGRSGKHYRKAFLELNKERLQGKEELRMGVSYQLPPLDSSAGQKPAQGKTARRGNGAGIRESLKEPLFGKENEHIKISSTRLAGACFYVVSGHGGPDPGAIGRIGNVEVHEDEYAYDVALRLARALMQEGAEVRIIIQDGKDGIREDRYLANSKRETCMGTPIPLNQKARLQQRCAKINQLYRKDRERHTYCRAIFLHVDSRSKSHQTDVYFYHADASAEGKRLANIMKNTFQSKYGKHQPNRGFTGTVGARNLYVLANTAPAGVFVELGNIQNAFDQRRFVINSNRQALANWMKEAFIRDYEKLGR